jgi:hypothetical protein
VTVPLSDLLIVIGVVCMAVGSLLVVAWAWRLHCDVKRRFDDLNARLDELYAEPKWRHGELFRASGPWKVDEQSDS